MFRRILHHATPCWPVALLVATLFLLPFATAQAAPAPPRTGPEAVLRLQDLSRMVSSSLSRLLHRIFDGESEYQSTDRALEGTGIDPHGGRG